MRLNSEIKKMNSKVDIILAAIVKYLLTLK